MSSDKATIIHVSNDEKFINAANTSFDKAFPGQNRFFILVDDVTKPTKYVSLKKGVILKNNKIDSLKNFVNELDSEKFIVFHGMNYHNGYIANRLSRDIRIIWILFGVEFYGNPFLFKKTAFYGSQTKDLYKSKFGNNQFEKKIKTNLRNSYYRIFKETRAPFVEIKLAMHRANTIGILYKEEFDLITKKINKKTKYFFKFTYYPIEKMVDDVEERVNGDAILLGNSASYTNNHLEVLNKINDINIGKIKIICPLSYGDKEYALEIKKEGTKLFTHNFEALIDFMPLKKYNEHIKSCGIVIMNHYRQQAVGNVMTMLWRGAKVFLNEKSTLYHYLKRLNVHVYSISNDLNSLNDLCLLSIEQQEHNRNMLKEELSEAKIVEQIQNYFKFLI